MHGAGSCAVGIALLALTSIAVSWLLSAAFQPSLFTPAPVLGPIASATDPILADDPDRVLVLLQLSDVHLSRFRDRARRADWIALCHQMAKLRPDIVLITGDLTDAKSEDSMETLQYEEEWVAYNQTAMICMTLLPDALWMDMRGNHDAFDVPQLHSHDDHFHRHSISKRHGTYSVDYNTTFGTYRFVMMDSTLKPGPHAPFNFFGHQSQEDLDDLQDALETSKANHTIVAGHYPLITIASGRTSKTDESIIDLLNRGPTTMYLCGHLHAIIPNMYARHSGFVELEAPDWRDSRMFRLMVIDNDLFSFTDVKKNPWPIVVISNPKDARFLTIREPLHRIALSSHIRFFVFSPALVAGAGVAIIDNETKHICSSSQRAPGLWFYACAWQPNKISGGLHTIEVQVSMIDESVLTASQSFSLDGTTASLGIHSRFLLLSNLQFLLVLGWVSLLLVFSIVCLAASSFPGSAVRYAAYYQTRASKSRLSLVMASFWYCLSAMHIYSKELKVLLVYLLYFPVGPIFIGEIVSGKVGALFVYGAIVDSVFIPSPSGMFTSFLQLVVGVSPLLFFMAVMSTARPVSRWTLTPVASATVMFGLSILQQYQDIYLTYRAYGRLAAVMNPVQTWFIFLQAAVVLRTLLVSSPSKAHYSQQVES